MPEAKDPSGPIRDAAAGCPGAIRGQAIEDPRLTDPAPRAARRRRAIRPIAK